MANIVSIGLVGGVASGKSLVGKMLVKLGAGMLDADRAGHVVLAEDAEVRRCVLSRWGDAILGKDGKVDRGAVARRVFGKDAGAATERKFLEELLHPRIRERLAHERDQIAAAGKPAVVLDAPLLLEAGWGPMCDVVVMIDSPREARLERAAARGWSEAEFDEREAAQWSVAAKRQRSDVVIPNLGTESDLRRAVVDFWARHIAPTTP
jgi:dephospho-CoA kinase